MACGGIIPNADFSLPSYKLPILLANIFLKLLSDVTEMSISEKTRETCFLFLSGLPEWLQEVAKQWGALGFSSSLGDLTKSACTPIRKTPFTLFHLPATITSLTAVTAHGQAKGKRKRKVYLESVLRNREQETSAAHYGAICELLELWLFPDYRVHHSVFFLLLSPYPAPYSDGARLGRIGISRSSNLAGGIALWVQSELTPI